MAAAISGGLKLLNDVTGLSRYIARLAESHVLDYFCKKYFCSVDSSSFFMFYTVTGAVLWFG